MTWRRGDYEDIDRNLGFQHLYQRPPNIIAVGVGKASKTINKQVVTSATTRDKLHPVTHLVGISDPDYLSAMYDERVQLITPSNYRY